VHEQAEKLKQVATRDDAAAIHRESEALQKLLMDLGAAMYGAQQASQEAPTGTDGSEHVVDADYDVKGGGA
jgi:hypothetical protein